jgi:phage terminase large subunit-like protein
LQQSPATSNQDSDETGIVVAGLGSNSQGYVLADISVRGTPDEWAKAAVNAYHEYKADRTIGETNNGGEMVETVIRMVDKNVAYKGVHASRGKITRAEPISALYEQKRCHHVGFFPVLEHQQCDYDPKTSKYSPDRMDALVWAFTELMTEEVAGEGWVGFMARQAAEAQLTAVWAKLPAEIEANIVAALVADGIAEVRDQLGLREWRRKPV